MIEGRVIRNVRCDAPTFVKSLRRFRDPRVQAEIKASLQHLLLCDLDKAPAFLHLHQLTNRKVQSALDTGRKVTPWTIHVTRNDAYKASFTLENGTAYMRLCDEHDRIDLSP